MKEKKCMKKTEQSGILYKKKSDKIRKKVNEIMEIIIGLSVLFVKEKIDPKI